MWEAFIQAVAFGFVLTHIEVPVTLALFCANLCQIHAGIAQGLSLGIVDLGWGLTVASRDVMVVEVALTNDSR